MINIDNQQMIRENLSNKKILKAIIADLYEDKKVKNLMSLAVDLGIEEEIAKKTSLTKQEAYRIAQIFHYEYGTNTEDAIVAVYQWADIFGVGYENDDLFFTAKELISANIDFGDWKQLKDDVFNVLSYAYVLSDNTERDEIVKNAEQLFDEINVEDNLIMRIVKIDEHDFLEKNIDRLFPGVYAIVDKAIKEQNIEIINIKCYTYIKIMKLLIATILYRNKKIYQSLYLILITAMFYADKYKLDKVGFKDKAIDEIVSFPSFEDVILHSDECEEMEYCDLAINEVNKKGKKLFDIVKRGTLTGKIERITQDLSSVYDEYLANNLEINVVGSTTHGG